jgi:hypothetical protein
MGLTDVIVISLFFTVMGLLIIFVKKIFSSLKTGLINTFIVPIFLLTFFSILIILKSYWISYIHIDNEKFFLNIVNIINISWWLALYWILNLILNRLFWVILLEEYKIFTPKIIKDFTNLLLLDDQVFKFAKSAAF